MLATRGHRGQPGIGINLHAFRMVESKVLKYEDISFGNISSNLDLTGKVIGGHFGQMEDQRGGIGKSKQER
jgi:hypothetical protein